MDISGDDCPVITLDRSLVRRWDVVHCHSACPGDIQHAWTGFGLQPELRESIGLVVSPWSGAWLANADGCTSHEARRRCRLHKVLATASVRSRYVLRFHGLANSLVPLGISKLRLM